MSWVTDNWIPLTVVGGLVGVSWYAGKHFDESESYNTEYDEEDMVYCKHCSDIVGNEKEVYGDETVDYEMANGELVCVPCYKIWMKEYENDLDPHYSPFYAELRWASTRKTKPIKTRRIKTMIELNPDLPITSHHHPDNPMVGHIEQKCSSDVCDETVLTHDRRIGKRCLKCYYQNWEDLYDMGATDTPPPVDMSIPYDVRYKRNTPAEIAEQEKRSIARQKQINANRSKRYEERYQEGLKKPLGSKNPKNILGISWEDFENDREWDKQYAQIMKDKTKMSDKGWRKKYGLKSESYNADEKRINGMTLDDWLDEIDRIKATKEPFYYSNNILGTPKYGNMIDMFWEQGWTPQGILDAWESYENQEGHWEKIRAETFNADEGLWNDASKEQRLKWLKDAIPSIGDKYADYTWRELTPRLQNEMADESYDAETFAAYVSKADTQRVRQLLKQEFPNLKFSVVKDGGRMSVSIMAGDIDFSDINDDVPRTKRYWERWGNPKPVFDGKLDINQYHLDGYNPKYTPLFEKIVSIMKGEDWFDDSDSQTDYFHTAYYIDLNIGKWNKPYEYKPNLKRGTRPTLESLVYKQGYGDDALTGLKGAYDEETFEAKGYEPNKPYYATMHTQRPTTVMHPIKCGHYKMVMGGTGVWDYPTFYDSIEEMVEEELFDLADLILADTEDKELIEQYKNLKTVGEARKWLSRTSGDGTKLNFAPCFKKEYDYDSKALNALPITPIPFDWFDAETFEAPMKGAQPRRGRYEVALPLDKTHTSAIRKALKDNYKGFNFSVKMNGNTTVVINLKSGKQEIDDWDSMENGIIDLAIDTIWEMEKGDEHYVYFDTKDEMGIDVYCFLGAFGNKEYIVKNAETFEASAVARNKAKTPVEKVLLHEELMNQAARNEMITKLTYDLAMRRGVHRQPMRTLKEAEYDSKLKKEFGDD
jgi:hypothetical protein